jgi:AraC-like DNA-binding protein
LECLADLVARHGQERPVSDDPTPRPAHLKVARDLLDACPAKVTLGELATLAGLSPFHFLRSFRRATGLPPHAYLIQVRVRKARSLLLRGSSAGEAALTAGFADQSHLNRHFKRFTGVTPCVYATARSVAGAEAR